MKPLAVIAGFGGINAAGRSSAHHYYRRTVLDALDPAAADGTCPALAGLMRVEGELDEAKRRYILDHTLIPGLEPELLDAGTVDRRTVGEAEFMIVFLPMAMTPKESPAAREQRRLLWKSLGIPWDGQ